jgi:hypothetical protein
VTIGILGDVMHVQPSSSQPIRTFHPSRGTAVILLISAGPLFWFGWKLLAHPFLGWAVLLFGGMLFVLACRILTPGLSYLRLDSEGFELKMGRTRRKTKWHDVKAFRIASFDERLSFGKSTGRDVIAIEYHPTYTRQSKARKVAKFIAGFEDYIPNGYNVSLAMLEKELRTWHAYYGKARQKRERNENL